MTKGKQLKLQLTRVKGRRVRVDFKGGEVTSDAGLLLIREVDRQLGLTERAARQLARIFRKKSIVDMLNC